MSVDLFVDRLRFFFVRSFYRAGNNDDDEVDDVDEDNGRRAVHTNGMRYTLKVKHDREKLTGIAVFDIEKGFFLREVKHKDFYLLGNFVLLLLL